MIQNVLQCCYTNSTTEVGNVVSAGWNAVCVSPYIPSDAFAFCTRLQGKNSSISGKMLDEKGEVLNLLEIAGDGNYIYMIRTQYGLSDHRGRENMFSHAYIFSCKDKSVIKDPNTFLTIANSNFKDNEEAANEVAQQFERLDDFKIESAMKTCGLTQETYLKLIECVYIQMSDKKILKPLYVQYDGSEKQLRALLFCIYYGLPFGFRRKLSVASVSTEHTSGMNLIFSIKAKEQELYIDPATGENTVLTPRIERRLSRLGFLSHAVMNISHPNIQQYYEFLETKALELGDTGGQNELFLKIAYIQMTSKETEALEDDELDSRMSDALRVNSVGNQAMDNYIASLLSEITARKLALTEENEAALNEQISDASSDALKKALEQYNFYRFKTLSDEEAAKKLSAMQPAVFKQYRDKLIRTEEGVRVLDYYYAEVELPKAAKDWKLLAFFVAEIKDLPAHPLTDEKVDKCAWDLYTAQISTVQHGNIVEAGSAYSFYMTIMLSILAPGQAEQCGAAAKEALWELITYENIMFDRYPSYKKMEILTQRCSNLLTYCTLPSVMLHQGDLAFFRAANAFFRQAEKELGAQADKAIRRVVSAAEIQLQKPVDDFQTWSSMIIRAEDSSAMEALIEVYRRAGQGYSQELMSACSQLIKLEREGRMDRSTLEEAAKMICTICEQADSEDDPIRLDDWLKLGYCLYENSFELFNELQPAILLFEEEDVAAESKLIQNKMFIEQAEAYIQSKGRQYKTVKKWLAAVHQTKKEAAKSASGLTPSKYAAGSRGRSDQPKTARRDRDPSAPERYGYPPVPEGKPIYVPRDMSTPEEAAKAKSPKAQSEKKGFWSRFGKKDKQ